MIRPGKPGETKERMDVNESGKIRVLKRDGTVEPFDARKLAGALWRAMRGTEGRYEDACQLALAMAIYVSRETARIVSSGAIFEMAEKVLARVSLADAAKTLRTHRSETHTWRRAMRVRHYDGKVTYWDKAWLGELACKSWYLMPRTGRIIAGQIEQKLCRANREIVSREELVEMVNRRVTEFGLGDAVPVAV